MEMDREKIVADIVKKMDQYKGSNLAAACLYWGAATVNCLIDEGEYACLQAGTAYWPRAIKDDGISPTHFGYEFDIESLQTQLRFAQGLLPEMHVWAGLPARGEIVDLTLRFQPEQCERMLKHKWESPHLDYFWGTAEDCSRLGYIYHPSVDGIKMAISLLIDSNWPLKMPPKMFI